MSVVYLAEHDWLQRKVALKVLAPQLAEDERFRERFVRESRLAASLDHPNVIPIFEAGASGADLFIAMRYVEGTDLRTLLARGRRARTRAGDRDRPAGRRGARRRARTGARAPGRQAGQRPARAAARFGGGGARLPLGLRADQALGERLGHHRDRAVRRDPRLRGARAVQGRYAGRAHRRLLARVRAVRVPHRPAAVHVRERRRPDVRAPAGAAALGHRGSTRAAARRSTASSRRAMAKAPDDRQASAGAFVDEAARALGVGGSADADGSASPHRDSVGWSRPSRSRPRSSPGSSCRPSCEDDAPRAAAGARANRRRPASPSPDPGTRVPDRRSRLSDRRSNVSSTSIPEDVKRRCLPARPRRTGPGRARGARVSRCRASRCCTSCSRRGTRWTHAFQVNANNQAGPARRVRHRHTRGGHVLDRRRAGRPGPVLHGRACENVSRRGPAAGPVPYRMDGRQQLDLRACGPERSRRPQSVRLVALGVRPDRVRRATRRRPRRTRRPRSDLARFATGPT